MNTRYEKVGITGFFPAVQIKSCQQCVGKITQTYGYTVTSVNFLIKENLVTFLLVE